MTQMEYRKLADLKKLPNNPRVIKKDDFDRLKASISANKDYFEARPVILSNRTGELVIIAGNQRYEASKAIGLTEIPTVLLENLTEEREREIVIRDNVSNGEWDIDVLANEWEPDELANWGVELKGFSEEDVEIDEEPNERERIINTLNLDLIGERDGFFEMPTLEAWNGEVPERFVGFNEVRTTEGDDFGVHFFIDDYQFERVWNRPVENLEIVKKYPLVLTPDFSLYREMPTALKIYNTYRGRLIGQYWQNHGVNVVPTLVWAEANSFEYVFDGLPEGGTVAVSSVGVVRSAEARLLFEAGMKEALARLKPRCIIHYGKPIMDFDDNINVIYVESRRNGK